MTKFPINNHIILKYNTENSHSDQRPDDLRNASHLPYDICETRDLSDNRIDFETVDHLDPKIVESSKSSRPYRNRLLGQNSSWLQRWLLRPLVDNRRRWWRLHQPPPGTSTCNSGRCAKSVRLVRNGR